MGTYFNMHKYKIGLMLLPFLCILYLCYGHFDSKYQNEKWITHTYRVLLITAKMKSQIAELELAFRNYALTRKPEYKDLFMYRSAEITSELAVLKHLTADNHTVYPILDALQSELRHRLKFYQENMMLTGMPAHVIMLKNSALPSITAWYDLIEKNEYQLLKTRRKQARKSDAVLNLLFLATSFFAFIIIAYLLDRSKKVIKRSNELKVEIKASNTASKILFDRIGEVLFSRDATAHRFLEISNTCEAIFGYTAEEFINDKLLWYRIIHPDDRTVLNSCQLQIEKGESIIIQYRIIHKNGTIRWVENSIVPELDLLGILKRIDGISRDITDKKNDELDREIMLNELVRQNIALEHFGYEVSHTLRAPVANIIGLSQILQVSAADSLEQREIIVHIQQSAYSLDKKIRNMNNILNVKDENVEEVE